MGFSVSNHGSIFLFQPLTFEGRAWVVKHVQRVGGSAQGGVRRMSAVRETNPAECIRPEPEMRLKEGR
jgi:hypothetical protein